MCLDTKLCLVILGFFCSSIIVLNHCKKLDGYKFPVYTTAFCPRIKTEWTERSSALNCNKSNGYMCLPNDRFDELLEFCYREPVERIQKGPKMETSRGCRIWVVCGGKPMTWTSLAIAFLRRDSEIWESWLSKMRRTGLLLPQCGRKILSNHNSKSSLSM